MHCIVILVWIAAVLAVQLPIESLLAPKLTRLATARRSKSPQLAHLIQSLDENQLQSILLKDHIPPSLHAWLEEYPDQSSHLWMELRMHGMDYAFRNLDNVHSLYLATKFTDELWDTGNPDAASDLMDKFMTQWTQKMQSPVTTPPKMLAFHEDENIKTFFKADLLPPDQDNQLTNIHPDLLTTLRYALVNTLDPMSDTVLLSWIELEKRMTFHHPSIVADFWDTYENQKIKKLSMLDRKVKIDLPLRISVKHKDYIITKQLGGGAYGIALKGHDRDKPNRPVVIKILKPNVQHPVDSFENEILALQRLARYITSDNANGIIVQRFVEGTPLNEMMASFKMNTQKLARIRMLYSQLSQEFYFQTGLIHGDIRPHNVIVDHRQRLHLIDFGMSRPAPRDHDALIEAKAIDQIKARNEFDTWIDWQNALLIIQSPRDADKTIIVRLVQRLHASKKPRQADELARRYTLAFKVPFPLEQMQQYDAKLDRMRHHVPTFMGTPGYISFMNQYIRALEEGFYFDAAYRNSAALEKFVGH